MYYVLTLGLDKKKFDYYGERKKSRKKAQKLLKSYQGVDKLIDIAMDLCESWEFICRVGSKDIKKLEFIILDVVSKEGYLSTFHPDGSPHIEVFEDKQGALNKYHNLP